MQKLKTNHYKSQLIFTKKLTKNNISYFGFKLNELIDFKLYKYNNETSFITIINRYNVYYYWIYTSSNPFM